VRRILFSILFSALEMSDTNPTQIHATGEATGFIPAPGDKGKPITVIGTNSIRTVFDATCLQQTLNARSAPGITDLVLNPDAHAGYGAPVGCMLTSPTHVYPGPVGVDIKCSMSFLQLDLPADQVADKTVRRALIDAILERTPTGPGRGQRSARKARKVGEALGVKVATDGASPEVLHALGIPLEWSQRCEDAAHVGHALASGQFRALQQKFAAWNIPLPGDDKELVYAPLGTPEANAYLDGMALGANFATVNHLLINALVLEAFQEIIPGVKGALVYFISHNIARKELLPDGRGGFAGEGWVHRKGATRAFPAGHPSLSGTPFAETGHPILLPGNPTAGSVIMAADAGAHVAAYSVNHGVGRCMGRKAAGRALDQKTVDDEFVANDILTNCRQYPRQPLHPQNPKRPPTALRSGRSRSLLATLQPRSQPH
jgi:RNA-splicing ligase RtcB